MSQFHLLNSWSTLSDARAADVPHRVTSLSADRGDVDESVVVMEEEDDVEGEEGEEGMSNLTRWNGTL